ncbi:MAG: response regulator [Syntrophales bacterium]|jgi:phosphate regulon transcriptional regulator PhoB
MPKKILIVDDEKDIVDLVSYNLEKEGFTTIKAYDGESALKLVDAKKPDLVILDLMLPGVRGLEVCKFIRKNPEIETLPIIMLTAKGDQVDKILGLEMGADDYVTKPFNVRELIARVRAVMRRAEVRHDPYRKERFAYKGLRFDYTSYEVTVDGKKIDLGPTELKLLRFFTQHPGRVYTRDQLLDYVWGDETFVEPRTVDVHISRLRMAVEEDKDKPQYILTVRGIGYKFVDTT